MAEYTELAGRYEFVSGAVSRNARLRKAPSFLEKRESVEVEMRDLSDRRGSAKRVLFTTDDCELSPALEEGRLGDKLKVYTVPACF